MKRIADTFCEYEDICKVLFWNDKNRAATGVPMTDDQVNAQIGQYNKNKNTGLDEMLICVNGDCKE